MAKVLLADDEAALRGMMARQLERAGHEVLLAEDGEAAIELMQRHTFDVVVSDMKMPRLDGLSVLARSRQFAPDTEFIILTGHGSVENAVEAFKTGNLFDYLLKPLEDIRELDVIVSRAAERRRLKLENDRLIADLAQRVRELEEARQQLAEQAERDLLTGLLNYRAIHVRLQNVLEEQKELPISVMLLDMDGFKSFNETYGYTTGDATLCHISQALREACGENSYLGRLGGDEFMAVMPGTSAAQAMVAAERVRQYLASRPFLNADGTPIPVHLCFGIADAANVDGYSSVHLAAAAEAALYESKQRGGNSITLHNLSEKLSSVTRTTFDVLDSLINTIDNKDRYTRRHSEEVAFYALLLADTIGMPEETCNALRMAGILHDIGKIGVPDSILRKPGPLTHEEYEVMKGHVMLSSLIIHGLPNLEDILDAVSNHHERWDGKGYPRGLSGKQIPLLGRVMAIADAFSAMTMDRPYRAGLPIDRALEEVTRGAGTQFDPNLAQEFVRAISARMASLRSHLRFVA
jgi:diguanylate cyclase (GGDEF)-like protein/putative nucleotidyltransferase with HDIG domain